MRRRWTAWSVLLGGFGIFLLGAALGITQHPPARIITVTKTAEGPSTAGVSRTISTADMNAIKVGFTLYGTLVTNHDIADKLVDLATAFREGDFTGLTGISIEDVQRRGAP